MLHLVSGLYTEWTRRVPFHILILGPGAVGKTALLETLKLHLTGRSSERVKLDRLRPTIGQNVLEAPVPAGSAASGHRHLLKMWDLGGGEDMQRIWKKYYAECHALLWVVDAAWWDDAVEDHQGREPANASWELLRSMLQNEELAGTPFVIVLTQTDRLRADQSAADLEESARLWWASRIASLGGDSGNEEAQDSKPVRGAETVRPETGTVGDGEGGSDPGDQAPSQAVWDLCLTSAVDGTGIRNLIYIMEILADRRADSAPAP